MTSPISNQYTSPSGIQDYSQFGLNQLQQGASSSMFPKVEGLQPIQQQPQRSPIQAPQAPQATQAQTTMDLSGQLAQIQAMNQGQSSGIGGTIGGAAGTGASSLIGGPEGAAAGAALGAVGNVVDFMINSDKAKKAEQIKLDAIRREKIRMTTRENSDSWMQRMADAKSMAISTEQANVSKYELSKQLREQFIQELFGKVAATKQRKQQSQQSFIQSRSLL